MRSYYSNERNKLVLSPKDGRRLVDRSQTVNKNFTGPSREVVLSSSKTRLQNIGHLGQYEYLREEVIYAEKRFVTNFYEALKSMNNKIEVSWVDACKARHKELFEVFTAITLQPEDVAVVLLTANGKVYNLDELTYAPNRFLVKGVNEEEEIIDVYISHNYPKMYAPLFVAMFKVSKACQETRESDPDLFSDLKQLAFSLYERGGLYNETNPDDREWRRQEDNTLSILTGKPTREEDDEVSKAYAAVKADILSGIKSLRMRRPEREIKPYVLEICTALVATYNYCHSTFSKEDYYVSMASDAAEIRELSKLGVRASILKSAVEGDPLSGCDFDKATGYVSHYNSVEAIIPNYWITTIHIPNPGKFKTRAIHLAISAIQDRCCWIHNRLYALLKRIPSDCTKYQERGIEFLRQVTDPFWREDRFWPSVLAYDWSNATDKLWGQFQEDVLRLVFDEPIVEFWHQVSTCSKLFKHKDKTRTPYEQLNGQPQGLLGSFDAFAFAHHIMMLMTMYMSNRTEYKASEFYRVLGDDSIICSITLDKENLVGRSYQRVCQWCNTPINLSKSTQVLCSDSVALVEFAKIYALDGEYFSPIPERLANRIGLPKKEFYALASAFWGQRHGMDNRVFIERMIDRYYPNEVDQHLAKKLMFSSLVPSFNEIGFVDPGASEDEEALKLTLCYWFNKIKATFALNGLSDKAKEDLSLDDKELQDALLTFIPEELGFLVLRIEDYNHKLLLVTQDNLDKEIVIREFLNCTKDQALIISTSVWLSDDEAEGIRRILRIIEDVTANPNSIFEYQREIAGFEEKFKPLERLNYRSIYKRDTLDIKIFRPALEMYKKLFSEA